MHPALISKKAVSIFDCLYILLIACKTVLLGKRVGKLNYEK